MKKKGGLRIRPTAGDSHYRRRPGEGEGEVLRFVGGGGGFPFTVRTQKWPLTGPQGRQHRKKPADRQKTADFLRFPEAASGAP